MIFFSAEEIFTLKGPFCTEKVSSSPSPMTVSTDDRGMENEPRGTMNNAVASPPLAEIRFCTDSLPIKTSVPLGYCERSHTTILLSVLVTEAASAGVKDTVTVSPDMLPSPSRGASYEPTILDT